MFCRTQYKRQCQTVNDVEKKCQQVFENECHSVPEQSCVNVPRTVQGTVHDEQCSTVQDQECTTRFEKKLLLLALFVALEALFLKLS